MDRIQAIIQSMTPAERDSPKIINGSRRARIASGSGTKPQDVNQLLDRFDQAQKMMVQMARNGGATPGMGNLPGSGKKSKGRTAAPARKVKGRSGNPAKRAIQERESASRRSAAPAPGSAFGVGASKAPNDPAELKLPPGFGGLFGG